MRLTAHRVGLSRGGTRILEDIDASATGGEFVAVIGPNGAGKSSLLRLLAGLGRPDSGEVAIDGLSLARYAPRKLAQLRAYLPQSPHCDWPLPVERLVALGLTPQLTARGELRPSDQARLDAVLADCDLSLRRRQPVTTLSGGERARAMLARAMVGEPRILIVDEPLAGLDPSHALDAARRLRAYAVNSGKLVIAAVHDLNIVLRHATRLWALRGGRLLADGPPDSVLTPALMRELYDVAARVWREGDRALVDVDELPR